MNKVIAILFIIVGFIPLSSAMEEGQAESQYKTHVDQAECLILFENLPILPTEIWEKMGFYLYPKDVLSFQESCSFAQREDSPFRKALLKMMGAASLIHPIPIKLTYGVNDTSWSIWNLFGNCVSRISQLIAKQNSAEKSGVLLTDLFLKNINIDEFKELVTYCKNLRSITVMPQLPDFSQCFGTKTALKILKESEKLYNELILIDFNEEIMVQNISDDIPLYLEIIGEKFYEKLEAAEGNYPRRVCFVKKDWDIDLTTRKIFHK